MEIQRPSEKLERAGTVDFKKQGPGSVGPRFPAGLPFPVLEIPEFKASAADSSCGHKRPARRLSHYVLVSYTVLSLFHLAFVAYLTL